jgi:hypothetical protein
VSNRLRLEVRSAPQRHLPELGGGWTLATAARGLAVALLLSSAIIAGLGVQEGTHDQAHGAITPLTTNVSYADERAIDGSPGAGQSVRNADAGVTAVKLEVLPFM